MLGNSGNSGKSTNGRTGHKRPRVQFGPPTGQPVNVQTVQPVVTPPTPKPQATGGGEDSKLTAAA
jgi:hypothetical protein